MAIVNTAEIELGKLARDRGTTETVKKFAQMMIDQHTASGEKVKALASDLKIDTPDRLDDQHLDQRDKLAKESGTDFDREYTSTMVAGHKDLIDQLEHRIDKKTLEQWKIGMKGKTTVPSGAIAILPDRSDDPTTMRVNQLAADSLPDCLRASGSRQGDRDLAQEAIGRACDLRRGSALPWLLHARSKAAERIQDHVFKMKSRGTRSSGTPSWGCSHAAAAAAQ